MSPAEIYDEYVLEIPEAWPHERDWVYVHDGQTADVETISALLSRYIDAPQVIVIVHANPGFGAILPKDEAASFVAGHIRDGDIQVSDTAFTCFVAVSRVGVATGWTAASGKG